MLKVQKKYKKFATYYLSTFCIKKILDILFVNLHASKIPKNKNEIVIKRIENGKCDQETSELYLFTYVCAINCPTNFLFFIVRLQICN